MSEGRSLARLTVHGAIGESEVQAEELDDWLGNEEHERAYKSHLEEIFPTAHHLHKSRVSNGLGIRHLLLASGYVLNTGVVPVFSAR